MNCFRCGNKKQVHFCEECYQKLVAENLKLQCKIEELEKQIYKPKHMKVEKEDDIWKHITLIDYNIKE